MAGGLNNNNNNNSLFIESNKISLQKLISPEPLINHHGHVILNLPPHLFNVTFQIMSEPDLSFRYYRCFFEICLERLIQFTAIDNMPKKTGRGLD